MRVRIALLRFLLQRSTASTVAFFCLMVLYMLFKPDPLDSAEAFPAIIVFFHCYSLASSLGRPADKHFAFLFSRGYSRDTLWLNTMIATAISVLAVWLPAAIVVWTPLRANFLPDPEYPIVAAAERTVPLAWLAWYALLMPFLHYEWIRWAQPTRGAFGATLVQAGMIVVAYPIVVVAPWPRWPILWAPGALVALGAFTATRRLYARIEVPA